MCTWSPQEAHAHRDDLVTFPSLSGGLSLREGFFLEGGLTLGKFVKKYPVAFTDWPGLDGPALSAQVGTRSSTLTLGWGTVRILIPPVMLQSIIGVAYNRTYSGEDRIGVRARALFLLVGLSVGVYWPIVNQSTGSPLFNVGLSLGF